MRKKESEYRETILLILEEKRTSEWEREEKEVIEEGSGSFFEKGKGREDKNEWKKGTKE